MHDLVGAYQRLNSVYSQYIESAFPLRYPSMIDERRRLLSGSTILSQPPLLEPTPVYPGSGLNLAQASRKLPSRYHDLQYLARDLMGADDKLWRHQWNSLTTVLQDGKDLVVTTGTGSGKTECFLLPILAELARESASWPKCPDAPVNHRWWEDDSSAWVSQWRHSGRQAQGLHAVRAMILYPFNALVEDQLRRLRRTLDSDGVHRWLDAHRGGNRITFGRYTGSAPVSGTRGSRSAVRRLRERLRDMAEESEAVRADSALDEDTRYYFPNIGGGEMWSRWDMQDTPPDIFITNYSMLNIMLMRNIEAEIFDKTKAWLESDPSNKFFLVVDELHSYRGTPGTEVAYILRLLIQRLGLSVDSKQLVILSTSASVKDTAESRKFLQEFFGRADFRIISESQELPDTASLKALMPFKTAFEEFAKKVQPDPLNPMEPPNLNSEESEQAMRELVAALGLSQDVKLEATNALADALLSDGVRADHALRTACMATDEFGVEQIRPAKVPDVDERLFGNDGSGGVASRAMRGLLLALGMSQKQMDGTSPQPVRGHLFFHNFQNMWACANPLCDSELHAMSGGPPVEPSAPVGALHAVHRMTCSCGGRVLDLIVCEVCGDVFLGGFRGVTQTPTGQKVEILTADLPDIADMPNRVSSGQHHKEYAVFWPVNAVEPAAEPHDIEFSHDSVSRRWNRAKLEVNSGRLMRSSTRSKPGETEGWLYTIQGDDRDKLPAMPPKCPRCDADYRRRLRYPTPLRIHRTGFQKGCQVIAGALAREMPTHQNGKPSRKLVIFSDSRQDAAKLASGMEQDHYRDMVRVLLLKAMQEYWDSFEAALRLLTKQIPIPGSADKIAAENSKLGEKIALPLQPGDEDLYTQFQSSSPVSEVLVLWLVGAPIGNPQALHMLKSMIADYPGRVPLAAIRDKVKLDFLKMGINPGGNGFPISQYRVQVGNNDEWHSWHECYDWEQDTPQQKPNLPDEAERLLRRIDSALMSELMFTLFQHSVRTLESLGTGWVTYRPHEDADDGVVNATEAVIRLLGMRRRYKYSDFFYGGVETRFPRYIGKYLENAGVPENLVKAQFSGADIEAGGTNNIGLNPDNLYVMIGPDKNANGQVEGLRCPKCSAFFLHPTGRVSICPDCEDVRLEESTTRENFDYYVYLAEQSGPESRLQCQELTGQTDDGDRPRRQRWFQEVFVGDEKQSGRIHGVDLLSVTTTMEAGVDIGGLEVVMMANMPPRRFNYQQRVGRAGRRGAGVSLAVTFCRGRSHDDYYYQRPEQITGDAPPPPYVDVSTDAIFKRVFVKEILRLAFNDISKDLEPDEKFRESVHGEFGPISVWDNASCLVQDWLDSPNNESAILIALDSLRVGTAWENGAGGEANFCQRMLDYAREALVSDISDVVGSSDFYQQALSERIAHAGLLPMFGFPTDVRLLYTRRPRNTNPWPPERHTIDRDLEIAISQFAPGSQTVKDKAVHTAVGVVEFYPEGNEVHTRSGFTPDLPGDNAHLLGICRVCQSVQYCENRTDREACRVCLVNELEPLDAREPKGFFTDFEPQDYDGVFEWTPRSTRPTLTWESPDYNAEVVANCAIRTLANQDIISVNDNDGAGGFEFQQAQFYKNRRAPGAYAVQTASGGDVHVSGNARRIALLSRKMTDVLLVGIRDWPEGVFADPSTAVGRAAWYSLAFFLRSSAAALMDVDTLEFNAGFRPIREDDRAIGQAFLSDTLQNGAGYCWWLGQQDNFTELLRHGNVRVPNGNAGKWADPSHAGDCDTSCNRCLRDFYNLAYHGLMDWRLAIDMARLALDSSANLDLISDWSGIENPWRQISHGDKATIPATLNSLGYTQREDFGSLNGYVDSDSNRVKIERHPLWTDKHPTYKAARSEAESRFQNHDIKAINPFEVIRRPASLLSV